MNEYIKRLIKPFVIKVLPNKIIVWKSRNNSGKYVALTFDDGPDPYFTDDILNILHEHKASATFLIGSKIEKYPDLALKIKLHGHEIGNHSYSHNSYSKAKLKNVKEEVGKAQNIIRKVVGLEAALFRPPYGILSLSILWRCLIKGLTLAMWSVDTRDHEIRSIEELREKMQKTEIRNGDIVLMHDNNQHTLQFLPEMIEQLKRQEFNFVTISSLMKTRK